MCQPAGIIYLFITFLAQLRAMIFRFLGAVRFMAKRRQRRWNEQINWLL